MEERTAGLRPLPLTAAAAIVAVQAAVLIVLAVVEAAASDSQRLSLALSTTLFFVLAASGLGTCAWGLAHLRRWSRGPAVLTQLIQVGLAWSFAQGATLWVGMALGVAAVVALGCLFAPSATAALVQE